MSKVVAIDGNKDRIRCGSGDDDFAHVDAADTIENEGACEYVEIQE